MALAVPPGGTPPPDPRPDFSLASTPALDLIRTTSPLVWAVPARSSSETPRKPPAPPAPTITVVIVNFCQWRNTARLVQQLRQSMAIRTGAAEILILDNHSPYHPIIRKLEKQHGVSIRRFGRNLGFARAVNRGFAEPRPEPDAAGWVLLLNPDVTVAEGFLDDALNLIEKLTVQAPDAGVVGFRLLNPDGSSQASSGSFPSLLSTVAGLFLPRSRRKCSHRPESTRQPVGWVTGGCFLVQRECLRQLRGLDESFFLYYEDVDFCRRAAAGGWTVWFDPSLEVTHHWPLHVRRVPAPLRLMTRHALLTYARKHWSGWRTRVMNGVVWTEAALRQASAVIRGDWDGARCYGELRRLVGDVVAGRDRDVRRRLRRAAAFLDPIAAEQDGRTG